METMELFLVLVIAVLVSALLDKVFPHVAAPLVQIAIGLAMALALSISPVIEANPELFMLLFIAPLLFYESKELDKAALWKDKGVVLSLAIGLVLVLMVLVGLALHLVFPDIPIALCFAVGLIGLRAADNAPLTYDEATRQHEAEMLSEIVNVGGVDCVPKKNVRTYLIMGVDNTASQGENYVTGGQCDTLQLVVVDRGTAVLHEMRGLMGR